MGYAKYDRRAFVRAYMNAYKDNQTIGELAEVLKISKITCQGRLVTLRRKGVKLPNLARVKTYNHVSKKEVDDLNGIVTNVLKKEGLDG
jgi:hypothetical protein